MKEIMLNIRECSDLHLEFYYDLYDSSNAKVQDHALKLLPHLPTDKDTVLIVAGDLATAKQPQRIATFFELVVPRFKHVIYVIGNHEHYGMHMTETLPKIESTLQAASLDYSKMTVAGNDPKKVKIDGVTFLCGTMWTDYAKGNEEVHAIVARCIADHRHIYKTNSNDTISKMPPADMAAIFNTTIAKFEKWMNGKDNSRTVIVTHHMPSMDAVDPQYMKDHTTRLLNHAFGTHLNEFILKHKPAMLFFGHTHTAYHGKVGDSELHCNPLGYPNEPTVYNNSYDTKTVYQV
jgi:predicted MPP superfamily phosphohydrolase